MSEGARLPERARQMEARVVEAATRKGLPPTGLSLLVRAHRAAMSARSGDRSGSPAVGENEPGYLHPGRTVLILLDDLDEADPRALAVGSLVESRDLESAVPGPVVEKLFGDGPEAGEGLSWWRSLPRPDWRPSGGSSDDETLEGLVTGSERVLGIALAEALDHLRHAHLWESAAERLRALELAQNVLGPASSRAHPTLERRFEWWIRRVGRSSRFTT